MSFNRVNPFGWQKTDTLTSDQINQLDTNISNSLDKRDGYTDSISSDISVTGSMTFLSGSSLVVQAPADIVIADGYLAIDPIIIGDTNPLRLGVTSVAISSTRHTVSASDYVNYVLVLTGTLTADTNLIMPTLAGYSKFILNNTTGDFNLTIKTSSGSGFVLPKNKSCIMYCDGTNLYSGPMKNSNYISEIQYKSESSDYGTAYTTTTSTSYENIATYLFSFTNVDVGDKFEITYTATINISASNTTTVCVYNSETLYAMKETQFANVGTTKATATMSSVFTASVASTNLQFALAIKVSAGTGTISSPLSFTVKQIKK